MKPRLAALSLSFAVAASLVACKSDAGRETPSRQQDSGGGDESQAAETDAEDLFDSSGITPSRLPPNHSEFQQIFADVAEIAIPAVVSIISERNVNLPDGANQYDDLLENGPFQYFFGLPPSRNRGPRQQKETGLGSGVIISPKGFILTNNHVIEGADAIKVKLFDETEYTAEIVGSDKPTDMAVIRIKEVSGKLPTIPLGNSDKLRIGEWVIAVGNPYGLSHTVTTGIISAKGRKNTGINSYENFLQTDAAINPGNSGGALLNLTGELIGINTAIFSRSGGYQGIGFAIPINMAKKITQDLIRDGEVTRGWLGVSIQPIEPELAQALKLKDRKGALVGGVVPGSPADKAGIKRGDVILKVADLDIKDANDLLNRIALLNPNEWADIRVFRDGKTMAFKTKIVKRDEKRLASFKGGEEEAPGPVGQVGLEVAPLSKELHRKFGLEKSLDHGVVVTRVEPGSRASEARLREGDVILEVNRVAVSNPEGFKAALATASRGNKILLLVSRDQSTFFTTF